MSECLHQKRNGNSELAHINRQIDGQAISSLRGLLFQDGKEEMKYFRNRIFIYQIFINIFSVIEGIRSSTYPCNAFIHLFSNMPNKLLFTPQRTELNCP